MGDKVPEHPTNFCWGHFAGEMPPTTSCTIYYGLRQMKEEQQSLIQQKKIIDAVGIEPLTSM
jgi:hypothetical protein